ncbi:18125_t:CDS:2, partial [Cetraspora pellucida]
TFRAKMASQYEFLAIIKEEVICEFCDIMRCLCDSNDIIIVTKEDHMCLSGTDIAGWQHPIIKLKARMFSTYHASYENYYKLFSPGIKPIFKSFTKVAKLMFYVKPNSNRIVFEIGDQTADVMKFSRSYTNLENFDLMVSNIDPKDCKNKWTIIPSIMKEWLNELGRTVTEITFHHIKNEGIHIRAVDEMKEDE